MTEQVDMSAFIAARSDQLNADDLTGGPKTITITKVTASPDSAEQPVSVHYEGGQGKVFKPCKTVRRIMVGVWGPDASKYAGRSMTLYRDPEVAFGGMKVGGIRVSHMSHIESDKTVALLVTRGRKAPFKVMPLKVDQAPATETARQTPEEWANAYVDKVKACGSLEELIELQTRSAKALAKLATDKPDLHDTAAKAGTARAAELQETEVAE